MVGEGWAIGMAAGHQPQGRGGAWLSGSRVPQDGQTPLHYAALRGPEAVVGVLLEAGADTEATDMVRGAGGMASRGRFGVVRIGFVLDGMMPPHSFLCDLRYCCNLKMKTIVQFLGSLEYLFLRIHFFREQYLSDEISMFFSFYIVLVLSWNGVHCVTIVSFDTFPDSILKKSNLITFLLI